MVSEFKVDDEKYALINHRILLSTTEYIQGATVLTIQIISKELDNRICQSINNTKSYITADQTRYYISKTYDTSLKQIKQTTFFDRFKELKNGKFQTEQEICEEYHYIDKNGRSASTKITVVRRKNMISLATIEFNSLIEMEAFIIPDWLSPIISDEQERRNSLDIVQRC